VVRRMQLIMRRQRFTLARSESIRGRTLDLTFFQGTCSGTFQPTSFCSMRITPNQQLFNFPADEIRRLMRACGTNCLSDRFVALTLNIPRKEATSLLNALKRHGFIAEVTLGNWAPEVLSAVHKNGGKLYELTIKGHALRMATARKPIKRKTAERLVAQFLGRVEQVNKDPDLLYWIDEVIAFGSYITEAPNLGDIDLGVRYSRRTRDETLWITLYKRSLDMAQASGRHLATVIDKVGWPQREIEMRLRNRSSSFHLQELREEGDFIQTLPHVLLYTRKR
jgi:hypothetical protein